MTQREGDPRIPVLPVRDLVLFPGIIVPLFVGRPRSLKALEEAMLGEKTVFVVAQKELGSEDPGPEDFYDVGTLCQVIQMVRVPDGTTKALVEGLSRGRVLEYFKGGPYFDAAVEPLELLGEEDLPEEDAASLEPLRRSVLASFERYATLHPKIPGEVVMSVHSIEDPHQLADIVASHLLVRVQDKQKLLEILDPLLRLEELFKLLLGEVEILELEHDIHDRVRQEMEKNNREYYLKEQLRVIQDELGQGNIPPEIGEYRKKIETSKMPKSVEERALKELERLTKMPSMSAEATVARTYLDWLVELPWQKSSRDRLDIQTAQQVLEEDHYGMEKIKERVLEFLAVRKRAGKDGPGQVLCFVGPPGVGKTSLGRSIARALGRKFVNISLGGMRDEAEIRGHRRTYVGALPGRIIQKIRASGTRNPVMLLDEIDKIGSDFRGDPAAALLEVLDPEQNASFTDHFLEIPFDLSKVLFLTTANVTHTIPRALLDRMELISLPGYVQEEKVHIAQKHLWTKVCKDHGLQEAKIALSTAALEHVIQDYTREAGVRGLERQLAKLARKITRNLVELGEKGTAEPDKVVVNVTGLKKYLGPPMIRDMRIPSEDAIGTVVGLAWTESGGDTLVVETMVIKGKGNVLLTGNLGNIMQESAKTALGYIRGAAYASEDLEWDKTDVHVHVPEGAIPKDGPSAGITLAVAMISSITKNPVRNDIAMTGEITLRGNVLPVGGVREKILAAKRQDLREVLIPEGNTNDVEQLPRWVLSGITVHYVRHLDDVLRHAFRNLPA